MARSPTGTFTLVAGNPVVTGTIITSDWANTTMPDIGAALTDSLSRTGKGGMLAPIRGVNGSASAPAHSFTNAIRSGLYIISGTESRYAVNGVDRMRWRAGLPTQTYDDVAGIWKDIEAVGVVKPNVFNNSNFQIAQRGMSAVDTGGYYVDRWLTATAASVGGSVSTVQPIRDNAGPFLRLTTQGATGPSYVGTTVTRDALVIGEDYTFTASIRRVTVEDQDALLRVFVVVDGAVVATLMSRPVKLNSGTVVSATFNYTHSFNLSGTDSYILFRLQSAPTGLADGEVDVDFLKLEKNDSYSGYDVTPYTADQLACFRWFWRFDSPLLGIGFKTKPPAVTVAFAEGWSMTLPTPMASTPTATYTGYVETDCTLQPLAVDTEIVVCRVNTSNSSSVSYKIEGGTLEVSCELGG